MAFKVDFTRRERAEEPAHGCGPDCFPLINLADIY
jgi:hypothetical protein